MANFKVICLIQQPFFYHLLWLQYNEFSLKLSWQYRLMSSCLNGLDLCYILLSEKYSQRNLYFGVFHLVVCRYNFQERIREGPNPTTWTHLWTFLQSHLYRFSSAMVTWYNINPHLLFSLIWLRDLPRQKLTPCVQNVKIGRVGVFWTGAQMYHCWATRAFSPVCPRVFVVAALFPIRWSFPAAP